MTTKNNNWQIKSDYKHRPKPPSNWYNINFACKWPPYAIRHHHRIRFFTNIVLHCVKQINTLPVITLIPQK